MSAVDQRLKSSRRAGSAGGNVAIQMGDDPLRQVVRGDFVGGGQCADLRCQPPVPADDLLQQAFVTEMVQATRAAVTLAGAVDQGQVAR